MQKDTQTHPQQQIVSWKVWITKVDRLLTKCYLEENKKTIKIIIFKFKCLYLRNEMINWEKESAFDMFLVFHIEKFSIFLYFKD